ncbi:MAG: type III pantothenate kinase [Bacteroidota bacterium]|nr:type III pantothenate kinase [Bacteroidota bacterium]
MNLIIDQGNTNIKLYFFLSNKIKHFFIFSINKDDFSFLKDFKFKNIIYSSVSGTNNNLIKKINKEHILFFDSKTAIPIKNSYKSSTIGNDRLAGAVGASVLFPRQNVLSIDIGSAITFDFIKKGFEYVGGNISPGVELRFKSLHNYTANLPMLKTNKKNIFIADNTNDAIIAGVQNGILYEINAYIEKINALYTDTKIVFTGGDSNFFAKKIKKLIFAESNLVAIGLNKILNYNIEK